MKILPIEKVREADAFTIANEPISSIDLMERAAGKCVSDYLNFHVETHSFSSIKIFVGIGNNGGDGLVIARLLAQVQQNISVFIVRFSEKESSDFYENHQRLIRQNVVPIFDISSEKEMPYISDNDLIIDAIFGSGLKRKPEGIAADVITHINKSQAAVVAIDIPSGLFSDSSSQEHKDFIIKATTTLSFAPMKLAFMFPENEPFFGRVKLLDIGLSQQFIKEIVVKNYLLEGDDLRIHLKNRSAFSHKGNYGRGLLIAGSREKFGAAVLCTGGCLRSGIGLLTVHTAVDGVNILQTTHPEAMVSPDRNHTFISELPKMLDYNAIGIGPGIGTEKETQNVVKLLIQNFSHPIVFDADAINILSENKTWLQFLPNGCIFTPHPKEFERLVGKAANDYERYELQRNFSQRFRCYVVLKGHHTAITTPDGSCYFNTTGNAGMATGGSGDVLTGIITGLLSQGYHPKIAALLGVYIHGLAGDLAAEKFGFHALLPRDIINYIGKAFLKIQNF